MTLSFAVEDTTDDVPRSRRHGVEIPPEFLAHVEASARDGSTKRVRVADQAGRQHVLSILRSLESRKEHGYVIEQGTKVNRDADGNPESIDVLFRVKGRKTETAGTSETPTTETAVRPSSGKRGR